MASPTGTSRSWKLQDFMAHEANVNCLALGHKSGRVMVTGGDDRKVNLWAIGKQGCFMSLSGHTTPIECVQFNQSEELVCAGSQAGALKVWDLEAAKLVRTLNGHKSAIKCTDFHPNGDFLVSGGKDSCIKLWDTRRKGCIFTYNGHKGTVNSLKFSPDGHWVASGSDDHTVKIWDLRVGRVLKDFHDHLNSVTCVEFHPHEFLLATGSSDRSVRLFDLENFNVVSSERDLGLVRCMCFNQDGDCLHVGARDYLKVVGWEPNQVFDSVPVNWGRVSDISPAQNQLIGASFHLTNVQVYVVDLKKVKPLGFYPSSSPLLPQSQGNDGSTSGTSTSPFTPNQSIRKSFSKAERPVSLKQNRGCLDVKTIEESTSGTDPEEEGSTAVVTNVTDYNEIFRGRGLIRTPPPLEEPTCIYQEPERDYSDPSEPQILADLSMSSDNFEALSLDNNVNKYTPPPAVTSSQYSRSKSNLDQVYVSRLTKQQQQDNLPTPINNKKIPNQQQQQQRFNFQRHNSVKDVPEKQTKTASNLNIKHSVSDINLSRVAPSGGRNVLQQLQQKKNSFGGRPNGSNSNNNNTRPVGNRDSNFNNSTRAPSSARNINNINNGGDKIKNPYITNPPPVDIYVGSTKVRSADNSPVDDFVPFPIDKPVGLDLDEFLPKNHRTMDYRQQLPDMSEAEVLGGLMRGHEPMMAMLVTRQRGLKVVMAQCRNKDVKAGMEAAIAMGDVAILHDLLGVANSKYTLWNLDLCVLVLPKVQDLLQSKYETYVTRGCDTLRLVLRHFGPVIKNNIKSPGGSFGVDIPREERYRKSVKCHEVLLTLRAFLEKKQNLMSGKVGSAFREIGELMQSTFDDQ